MVGQNIAARPLFDGMWGRLAALPGRNIRATVLLCVVAIGGSFAAAGALQMRLETANAVRQSSYFETKRAHDLAVIIEASLKNHIAAGRHIAADTTSPLPTDVQGVVVTDTSGNVVSATGQSFSIGEVFPLRHASPLFLSKADHSVIAFRQGQNVIAVSFLSLLPTAAIKDVVVRDQNGKVLAGVPLLGEVVSVPVPGFPIAVEVPAEDPQALSNWYASIPLYIFVIIGPALVGAWLATVFVREFERRAKTAQSIRSLRSTRPAEAKLLVRLANAERAAVESVRSKSEFIAHMSHELRTPLNAIIGFAEVIDGAYYGPVGNDKYAEYARDISTAGRHLHSKVGDILEFANLEAGHYPLAMEALDATPIVSGCVSDNAGKAFTRRITFTFRATTSAQVIADPTAIRRIMTNLLSNALLYTPEGGRIAVTIREDAGAVAIAVTDSGSGFTESERHQAGTPFRRFERVGVSTGTGLGLAIAVALARQMGGALRLASAPSGGTCAELRLSKAQ